MMQVLMRPEGITVVHPDVDTPNLSPSRDKNKMAN
jgi:hypothetical protein